MLPPVLEIYVIWHPAEGERASHIAQEIFEHFHRSRYAGLMADAVEVYHRSQSWTDPDGGPPRSVYTPDSEPPRGLAQARLTVIVPIIGLELARAARTSEEPWYQYLDDLVRDSRAFPDRCTIMPLVLDPPAMRGAVGTLLAPFHRLDAGPSTESRESDAARRGRELTRAIIRFAGGYRSRDKLTVFISHTQHTEAATPGLVRELIDSVRWVLHRTHLDDFFAPADMQPGDNWDASLRRQAQAADAMLALRTDQYAGREWCQREMLLAKRNGQPVVILDPVKSVEQRGSFIMDHVPRVFVRRHRRGWNSNDILRGLDILVDETLKRTLWRHQKELAAPDPTLNVWWWAPHTPEPVTFAHQLTLDSSRPREMLILHPEPALGPDELEVLHQIADLNGISPPPTFVTPAQLDARDGAEPGAGDLLPPDALDDLMIGLSVSGSEDLARLGLLEDHFRLAVAEIARAMVRGGGKLIYGGYYRPDSYTALLNLQVQREFSSASLQTPPLHVCLAWPEHRAMTVGELAAARSSLELLGALLCLDLDGLEIDRPTERPDAASPIPDRDVPVAFTNMREYMAGRQYARVFVGGRRSGYKGRMPGVFEEVLIALRRRQPIYLAAGFGGATFDIVRALGIDDGSWAPGIPRVFPAGYEEIAEISRQPGWTGLANGLTPRENAALAVSHRPSDIAGLVASGLGRLRQAP